MDDRAIEKIQHIQIVSGEGDCGTVEIYNGKKTFKALRARIARERCGGARWCYAKDADTGRRIE